MIATGELLAEQIDASASKKIQKYKKDHLKNIIHNGKAHVGRILHYFPFKTTNS
jgi:hypothetical protein